MANMQLTKTPMAEQDPQVRNQNFLEVARGYTLEEAMNEAKRCIHCKNPACVSGCPVGIPIPEFLDQVAQGNIAAAYEILSNANALPAISGRVCPQENQCEGKCVRGIKGEPVAIGRVERFVADWAAQQGVANTATAPKNGRKVAVIGSGPSGMSCAYYLALDGYQVTVFEKQEKPGGMLTMGIPGFRLEKNVVEAEIEVLRQLGVHFRTGVEVGKDVTIQQLRQQGFQAFYLAIGAQGGRKLNIPGEDAEGVVAGVDFLRSINLGSIPAMTGKTVVIGGGNVAIDVARAAARTAAVSVDMYCLEGRSEMPALPEEIREAEEEHVAIHNGYGPKEILVKDGRAVGVVFKKCLRVFDENHRFAPQYDENDTITVETDHVLLSIGQSIQWGNLLAGTAVVTRHNGTVEADPFTYQTAEPDIFAGGDVYTGPRFAIDAIAAGKEGAISIHRFVQPGQSLTYGRDRRQYHSFDKENVVLESFDRMPRQKAGHSDRKEHSFGDNRLTFTEEQMKKETQRCLGCGAVQVDEYMCVGCGQCTTKCKFGAISLMRKYNEFAPVFEKLPIAVAKYAVKRTGKIAASAIRRESKDA